jgi:hypothetical protein
MSGASSEPAHMANVQQYIYTGAARGSTPGTAPFYRELASQLASKAGP